MYLMFDKFRNFLKEDMTENQRLALYIDKGNIITFILYDIFLLEKMRNNEEENEEFVSNPSSYLADRGIILAMIELSQTDEPCWDAYEILHSASSGGKGLGFLLYKLAAAFVHPHPITGDHSSGSGTSKSARNVYNKLPAKTKDFDDIEQPQTPEPKDDCKVGTNTINKAYFMNDDEIQKMKNLRNELLAVHKGFVEGTDSRYNINDFEMYERSFLRYLRSGADALFDIKYNGQDG